MLKGLVLKHYIQNFNPVRKVISTLCAHLINRESCNTRSEALFHLKAKAIYFYLSTVKVIVVDKTITYTSIP